MSESAKIPKQHKNTVQPIRPSQVCRKKTEILPDAVLEVFNEMIAERWDGACSSFSLKEIRSRLKEKLNGKEPIMEWFDVEPIYREIGWNVKYTKSGWNNSLESFYEFCKE